MTDIQLFVSALIIAACIFCCGQAAIRGRWAWALTFLAFIAFNTAVVFIGLWSV